MSNSELIHCNACLHETFHRVVAKYSQKGSELLGGPGNQYEVSWATDYSLHECRGCKSVVLRVASWVSEADGSSVAFFPPRISRQMPEWSSRLPTNQRDLMKEVYTALNADSGTLATMGARALVDMVMNKEVKDIGGFAQKLETMKRRGIISVRNAEILEAALDVGHVASHRGHRPNPEQLGQVMDIVENLLQTQVLKVAAGKLKSSTPKRRRHKTSSKPRPPKSPGTSPGSP